MSTITTTELSEGLDDPRRTVVDIRPLASYNGWRRNGEARGGHIRGAVASRPPGWAASTRPRSGACSPRRASPPTATSSSTATAPRTPPIRRGPDRPRHRGCARLRGWGHGLGRRPVPAARAAPELREARPHPVAPRRARREAARGAAEREVPALPRQLRGPRGIRRGPHPGRPLPRHELAGGSRSTGTGAPRRSSRPPFARWASRPTRRSSSTAATPRATPRRSGRAVGPGRSRPPAR